MKNKENIFSSPDCLSMDAINRYLDESMLVKERHAVEKHMLECEFCADAVEGYALIKDKKKSAAIVSEINAEIKGMSSEKAFWQTRIAASVAAILILGAGLFYLNNELNKSNEVAVKQNKKEEILDSVKTSSNAPKSKNEKTIAIKNPDKKKEVVNGNIDEVTVIDYGIQEGVAGPGLKTVSPPVISSDAYVTPDRNAAPVESENIVDNIQGKAAGVDVSRNNQKEYKKSDKPDLDREGDMLDDNLAEEKKSKEEEVVVIGYGTVKKSQMISTVQSDVVEKDNASNKVSKNKRVKAASAPQSRKEEPAASMIGKSSDETSGVTLYNQKKYAEASNVFEQTLKNDAKNAEALYYNGLSYFALNNYDKAIEYFDKVTKEMAFYEQARWNKAMALVKKGDKAAAKILLEEISKGEVYKEEALGELKKLE